MNIINSFPARLRTITKAPSVKLVSPVTDNSINQSIGTLNLEWFRKLSMLMGVHAILFQSIPVSSDFLRAVLLMYVNKFCARIQIGFPRNFIATLVI